MSDLNSAINKAKLKFEHDLNIPPKMVDYILDLFDVAVQREFAAKKIKFKYVDNKYGKLAKKLYEEQGIIKRAYQGDAGIDLPIVLSEEECKHGGKKIWPGEREMFNTGIQMEFPIGYYGRIVHRSSTEHNHRLRVIEGIIDDYRGEIIIQAHNLNSCTVEVHHGDRLGQLIIARTCPFVIEEASDLRPSERGQKGFGSSGK